MKPLCLLVLLTFSLSFQQPSDGETAELKVVKFSWAKDKPKSTMIRGAQNPKGSISSPVTNDRDVVTRGGDLRMTEQKAAGSNQPPVSNSYLLRLELENTGPNIVKSLVWEFRPTAGPADYEPKRYLCALRVESKAKSKLEVWTPYAPVRVVRVDERNNALKDGEVIINQIEYVDGSVWKKHDWNYKLPANASQKLSDGRCSVF